MKKTKTIATKACAIALALLLALSISACGGTENDQATRNDDVVNNITSSPPPAQSPSPSPSPESSSPPSPEQSQSPAPSPDPSPDPSPGPVELIVFAAASMTETLQDIELIYKSVAPHVTLVFNFESSGTLKTQIEEGAECDLFISAAPRQMNELDELGFVLVDTRLDLLENKVALTVPSGNPMNISDFDSLVDALAEGSILMAMGNSDVPVGQYTQRIFEYYGLDEDALARSGVLSYGTNVKEVAVQVSEASVDCGIVYATDAFSNELQVVAYATADMCGQVIYPAAVLNISPNIEAAQAFLDYLSTPPAMAVFENVGFSPA